MNVCNVCNDRGIAWYGGQGGDYEWCHCTFGQKRKREATMLRCCDEPEGEHEVVLEAIEHCIRGE